MGMLKNNRHELFAQALAQGKTADEAYAEAGYVKNRCNASRLKTTENITKRLAELQGRATKGVVLTKQWILERLIANAERAMQAEPVLDREGHETGEYTYQGNVANRALELLGKEMSMFVDRKEVGMPGEFKAIEAMDADELRSFLRNEAEALGLRGAAASESGGNGTARKELH